MKNQTSTNALLAIALAYLLLPLQLQSQNRSFATLPLVQGDSLVVISEGDLNDTEDYDKVEKIYNNLVNARGDYRYPVPKLFLKDEVGYVASIDYTTNYITLEKKAYDAIKKYGDKGIAFLLAHELTHFYEKHAWKSAFARDNADLKIGKKLRSIDDQILNETEADYLGGFLAYTAGYPMFDKGGEIIDELYKEYNLKDTLNGYPSKSDRIKLGKRSAERIKLMVDAFDMANIMIAADDQQNSYNMYEYILRYYQSREIYNNLGTIAVMSAMRLFKADSMKFKYVSELDINFMTTRNSDIQTVIDSILGQAILQFNSAINLDPNYAPAYLNRANAYALKREWRKADFYLNEEALPVALKNQDKYPKTVIDIKVLQGIIAAKTGDEAKARQLFENAKQKGSKVAALNLRALDGEKINVSKLSRNVNSKDTIGGITIEGFNDGPTFNKDRIISLTDKLTFFQHSDENAKTKVYYLQDASNRRRKFRTIYISTQPGYEGKTSKGLALGDTEEKVLELYGSPNGTIETTQGRIHSFSDMIVKIKDNQVDQWIIKGRVRYR